MPSAAKDAHHPSTMSQGTLIFFHGVGDCGRMWQRKLEEATAGAGLSMKVVCPSAPKVPITVFGGWITTSWFDMFLGDWQAYYTKYDLERAAKFVHNYVDMEVRAGTLRSKIVLAGHSQGAALALYSALTLRERIGGVCSLGGWLPAAYHEISAMRRQPHLEAVLMCHGEADNKVPLAQSHHFRDDMRKLSKHLEFKTSKETGHEVTRAQLMELAQFCSTAVA